jgi:hypothetical protein
MAHGNVSIEARQSPQRALRTRLETKQTLKKRDGVMIHPSLIAIGTIVLVFGILNLIEFKRLD